MSLELRARTSLGALSLEVELSVPAGSCLALAGPSGAGKTSVLRIAAGLLAPASGFVSCGGETWLDTERGIAWAAEQRRCGYVFQQYALFEHLNVAQNVAYGLRGMTRAQRRARALELLGSLGIGRLADARPRTLSGGERQRVALARALAVEPAALLLDEPLSALDTRTRAEASRRLADTLRAVAVPSLLVTHDFAEAAQLGDRVAILDAGRIVQAGTASDLAARPQSAFVADFTGAVVLTGTAAPGPGGLTEVALDGGGTVLTVDPGDGPVAVCVYPWEIALEPTSGAAAASPRNRLPVQIISLTTVGNRVRVGLAGPGQPLTAEITAEATRALGLAAGDRVTAAFKAAATRVVAR